jgi:purine-nucleoside phosphorylase
VGLEPFEAADRAAAVLASRTGRARHDVAVVLGSGWLPAAEALGNDPVEVPFADLGGYPPPTVPGHAGRVRSVLAGGRAILVFLGRVHLYEGHTPEVVVHGVRTAVAAGCRTVVLTNAAGGVDPAYRVGQPVLIRDHLNLMTASPLAGAPPPSGYPSRFVDLTDCYSERLRAVARSVEASLADGVYAGMRGPHYETPAEITMIRNLGADLVGMSTVLETIAARHLGAQVLGISLVTNVAAGLAEGPVDHEEVIAAGAAAAAAVGDLLARIVARLP